MTPPSSLVVSMTPQEQINYLAEKILMWEQSGGHWYKDGKPKGVVLHYPDPRNAAFCECLLWNPLEDWNHWRQVEEKALVKVTKGEQVLLRQQYIHAIQLIIPKQVGYGWALVEADLPTRVSCLIAAHQSLSPLS